MWVTLPVLGSTRETLTVMFESLPPPLPIQSAPAPAAMSVGTPFALNVRVTLLVSGSMRDTVLLSLFRNQTAPSPTAMLLGADAASTNDAIFLPVRSMAATPFPVGTLSASALPPVSAVIAAAATAPSSSSPAARMTRPRRSSPWGTRTRRTLAGAASPSAAHAASISSTQVAWRSPLSLASALRSTGSSAGWPRSGGGGSWRCAHMVSASVSRWKGGTPATHS